MRQRTSEQSEAGYVLVAVVFMMAILVLGLSVAIPRVKQDIQRDRELETQQRGKQYIRAVQLYYRKFHVYPPSVDALESTDGIRFLRKRYLDPITGKEDWHPIPFGQNKVPTLGLFGQPVVISQLPGSGLGPGSSPVPGPTASTFGAQTSTPAPASPDPGSQAGSTPAGSSPSSGSPGPGSPSSGSNSEPTFGGGRIVGFSVPSEKASILRYKLQSHYNLWEFVYDARVDMGLGIYRPGASGTGAQNGSTTPGPGTPTPPSPAPGTGPPPPPFEPTD